MSSRSTRWRAREAQSGRVYDCGKLDVGGYPFRFEVRCRNASVDLISQTASSKFGKGDIRGVGGRSYGLVWRIVAGSAGGHGSAARASRRRAMAS